MITANVRAPALARLRPSRPAADAAAPVLENLAGRLVEGASLTDPGERGIAYALATLSAYAYSDQTAVATMATRLGLERTHCRMVAEHVDALFIASTAFLIQSADGRVVILVYRGTAPESLINWLTDFDVDPEKITIRFRGQPLTSSVHRGFYRNVRATGFEVVAALQRALLGRTVTVDDDGRSEPVDHPMEALYITGHSLGGAMAAMAAILLRSDESHDAILGTLKGVVTFGQPMVGDRRLARCVGDDGRLRRTIVRYVYGNDAVPQLPPRASGQFEHFGHEIRHTGPEIGGEWTPSDVSTEQMRTLWRLALLGPSFVARQLTIGRRLRFAASIADHLPEHYMAALQPDGVHSEFGA